MQTSTIVVLACLVAMAAAAQYEHRPAVDAAHQLQDTPLHDRSPRTKRGLLLLKKKLLLGALGLKAAKVGAVGVVGALALKKKAGHGHSSHGHGHPTSQIKIQSLDHHHFEPAHSHVEVHDWSG